MTWEQKLAALNAIVECTLKMRRPGDWYVEQSVDIKDGSILRGEYGNGNSPETAVLDHWERLTNIESPLYLVGREFFDGYVATRKVVRWNGFMWESVDEPKQKAPPCLTA